MAFAELKARQSVMWGNGPYERVSGSLADMHELVVDRLEPGSGVEWLDAGCGPGNLCFLAAERGANVTGMDLAPVLVERAKELARERGLDIDFDVGDAEEMRYDDSSFDVVSSIIGVMFAPGPRGGSARARACDPARRSARSRGLDAGRWHRAFVRHAAALLPTSA